MVKAVLKIFFGVLVISHVIAAPNDVKLEDIAEVTKADLTTEGNPIKTEIPLTTGSNIANDNPITLLDETPEETTIAQSQRQKRWYNFYGFPPVNPGFINRDDSFNTGVLGLQDPLVLIHRRLQDISNSFKYSPQPPPPPPPPLSFFPPGLPQFPGFVPIVYIPQVGCACTPEDTNQPPIDRPPQNNNNQNATGRPDIETRWPEMEDERQNWGIVKDDSNQRQDADGDGIRPIAFDPISPARPTSRPNNNQNTEDDGDGSRPISFEPIRPDTPMNRPAPPVEHGSVEGNITSGSTGPTNPSTTTQRPAQGSQVPSSSGLQPPSNCDSAILRCCHLPQITYDCFAYQGCPDPSIYGDPCDQGVISRVINRFMTFYGQING